MKKSIIILCMLAFGIYTYAEKGDLGQMVSCDKNEVKDTISVRRNNVVDIVSNYGKERESGYYHIYNAGTFIRKGYSLEIATVLFSAGSAVLLSTGYANESKGQKIGGYLLGAGALATAIISLNFHFKSGRELQAGANCIKYTY